MRTRSVLGLKSTVRLSGHFTTNWLTSEQLLNASMRLTWFGWALPKRVAQQFTVPQNMAPIKHGT